LYSVWCNCYLCLFILWSVDCWWPAVTSFNWCLSRASHCAFTKFNTVQSLIVSSTTWVVSLFFVGFLLHMNNEQTTVSLPVSRCTVLAAVSNSLRDCWCDGYYEHWMQHCYHINCHKYAVIIRGILFVWKFCFLYGDTVDILLSFEICLETLNMFVKCLSMCFCVKMILWLCYY